MEDSYPAIAADGSVAIASQFWPLSTAISVASSLQFNATTNSKFDNLPDDMFADATTNPQLLQFSSDPYATPQSDSTDVTLTKFWRLRISGMDVTVTLDGPYPAWHNAVQDYTHDGWKVSQCDFVKSRGIGNGSSVVAKSELYRNTSEHALLLFGEFRTAGTPITAPASFASTGIATALDNELAGYKNYDRAEAVLRPTLDKYPEDSLTIARMKAHAGDVQAARSEARHACEILRPIVAGQPENIERRIQLAQGYIFLAEPANALKVLLESLPESADAAVDARLSEAMASTFSVWLRLMSPEQQAAQRVCLKRLAAMPESRMLDDTPDTGTANQVATAFDDKQFFAFIIESSRWIVVVPFLRGTIAATEGDWATAERLLRSALIHADEDPSINNNLALILVNTADGMKDDNARLAAISEAMLMSARSVAVSPDIAEFHETHAQVLALNGSHEQAVDEWKQCLAMGLSTRKIHRSLAASLKLLGLTSEANQHELESQNAAF